MIMVYFYTKPLKILFCTSFVRSSPSLLMTHTVKFGVYLKEGIKFLVLTFAVRLKSKFDTANLNTFIFRYFPSQKSLLDYD